MPFVLDDETFDNPYTERIVCLSYSHSPETAIGVECLRKSSEHRLSQRDRMTRSGRAERRVECMGGC